MSVSQPGPTALVSRFARSGFARSSQRRGSDTVCLVVESLREEFAEIRDRGSAKQLGVNRGDTIGTVSAHDGQIRHPHFTIRSVLKQTDARQHGHCPRGISPEHRPGTVD